MTPWILSESETRSLREAPDGPVEATVFRREDLIALVYCDPENGLWNLLLSVKHNRRDPQLVELLQARECLLPGIENFTIAPKSASSPQKWMPDTHLFHLVELPVPQDTPTQQ